MRIHELPRWRFLAGMVLLVGLTIANLVLYVISDTYPFYPVVVGGIAIGLLFCVRHQRGAE